MYKSSLEICSHGYNIEQTDYYIANLEERITFAETAYADAVKRIKSLEAQNEILVKEIALKLGLVADRIGVVSVEEFADEGYIEADDTAESLIDDNNADENVDNSVEADEEMPEQADNQDITNLKSQIDELKSFFRE